jgi:hypothetical protein
MMGLSAADFVVLAVGVSAVIAAGYSIHRALRSIRAWGVRTWARLEDMFSKAVDASNTGHIVRHHLGPNGSTAPMHERVASLGQAQADHNKVATGVEEKVGKLESAGTSRHQENTRKLMDISARLAAVEKAQKQAATVAETTEARHQGDT